MESLLQDVRYGFRNLLKTRGLTTVAVVTLALGIGANTAIFSVVNAVLLQPLPFRDPGQLVRLYETEAAPGNYPFTGPDFLDWKTQNHTFQDMVLFGWGNDWNLANEGQSAHVLGIPVEANFFPLLGARAMLGRTFAPGEDEPGNDRVVILSYGLWQTQFAGDAGILNRTIELSAKQYTVVGVMPPTFRYPSRAQLWTPLDVDSKSLGQRGSHWLNAIGRLKPGVPLKQAQAEMSLIAKRLEDQYPDSNHKVGASLVELQEDLVGRSRDSLLMMLWAVGLVLLIACANVANLLLSRAMARQKEMAIRSALGAARVRLVRQLLTESVLLGLLGAVLSLAVGAAGIKLLASLKDSGIPRTNPIELNLPVLAFTFGLAVVVGLLFGIFPALQMSRSNTLDELRGGAGVSLTASRHRRLTSNLLVVSEVGLSLLLLVSAGMVLKDFQMLRNTNVGVRAEGVWTGMVQLPAAKYKDDRQRYDFDQALLERARAIPGVESAAITSVLPVEGGSNYYAKIRGKPSERMGGPLVEVHAITPGYFRTMGVPLLQGRDFTAEDTQQTLKLSERESVIYKDGRKPTADETNSIVYPSVINQTMARTFWPTEDPIGKMYAHGSDNGPWHEVVGVVGDVKQWGLVHAPVPEGYDLWDGSRGRCVLVLHTSLPPASMTSSVRKVLAETDSSLPLFQVRSMQEVIADQAAGQQYMTLLLGLFAGLALLLAAVGIYGVLSYLVTQRTREIGIRMSLGATYGHVLRMVLGQGFRLACWGFGLGIVGALAARKVIASSLTLSKPNDPLIYAAAAAGIALVALLACYLPARRATRVDPVVALRYE